MSKKRRIMRVDFCFPRDSIAFLNLFPLSLTRYQELEKFGPMITDLGLSLCFRCAPSPLRYYISPSPRIRIHRGAFSEYPILCTAVPHSYQLMPLDHVRRNFEAIYQKAKKKEKELFQVSTKRNWQGTLLIFNHPEFAYTYQVRGATRCSLNFACYSSTLNLHGKQPLLFKMKKQEGKKKKKKGMKRNKM